MKSYLVSDSDSAAQVHNPKVSNISRQLHQYKRDALGQWGSESMAS